MSSDIEYVPQYEILRAPCGAPEDTHIHMCLVHVHVKFYG